MKTRGGVAGWSLAVNCVGVLLAGCADGETPLGGALYDATTSWTCTVDDSEFWTITLTVQPAAG